MSEPTHARHPVPRSLRPLPGISESFFVHAKARDAEKVARLCAKDELGAVYTMPSRGRHTEKLAETLATHRLFAGFDSSVLIDAERYRGANYLPASSPLSTGWLQVQWDHGLPWALTDSGYVEQAAYDELNALFRHAEALEHHTHGQFILALPLDEYWLGKGAEYVRSLIDSYGRPVALMLGAVRDPLRTRDAVQGFLYLLESATPIAMLRTDQSAVGALAAGAAFSAMGTTSSLRHIMPPKGGPRASNDFSVLIPQGLSYHLSEKVSMAISLSPESRHWHCVCERCQDARLDTILDEENAYLHNTHAIVDVVRHVLDGGGMRESLLSWTAKCSQALNIHDEIRSTMVKWTRPPLLKAWADTGALLR